MSMIFNKAKNNIQPQTNVEENQEIKDNHKSATENKEV